MNEEKPKKIVFEALTFEEFRNKVLFILDLAECVPETDYQRTMFDSQLQQLFDYLRTSEKRRKELELESKLAVKTFGSISDFYMKTKQTEEAE